jgi:hypothetical protein
VSNFIAIGARTGRVTIDETFVTRQILGTLKVTQREAEDITDAIVQLHGRPVDIRTLTPEQWQKAQDVAVTLRAMDQGPALVHIPHGLTIRPADPFAGIEESYELDDTRPAVS